MCTRLTQTDDAEVSMYIEWLHDRLVRNEDDSFVGLTSEQLLNLPPAPEFWWQDREQSFRDGFTEGFDYAIEQARHLYRKKGFTRVTEVCNILLEWSDHVLEMWRRLWHDGRRYDCLSPFDNHPRFALKESWADIRARIIRRDEKCVRCGDVIGLEVDHIIEVQDGGVPSDDNLRTLCKVCHKGKRFWSK